MTVSPDRGDGARMSFLRFEDQSDGVHVIFVDVTNPGPVGTVSSFNSTDIATLDRTHSHFIQFSIDFADGTARDTVKIYVDNKLKTTGRTWEDYYRYDPEQTSQGNKIPTVDKLLFRVSGGPERRLTLGSTASCVDRVTLGSSGLQHSVK